MIKQLYEVYRELGDFLLTENLTEEQFNKLIAIREKLYSTNKDN